MIHPADPDAADRFEADWAQHGAVPRSLLRAIGGNSPYLTELALREPDTLAAIAAAGPDAVCDQALGRLGALSPTLPRARIAAGLRQAKRSVALAVGVADLTGAWGLEQVTGALSDLAEHALRASAAHLLRQAHEDGVLTLPHPAAPERGSGFVVLAMGKLGARELNYSSDVDLILLYDPACYPAQTEALGQVFTRMARDLAGLMEARDAGGYVFRVDLRLRPDPGSTPPCVGLPAALAYYESLGQTWERAAMIKARPVAGDIALGRRFLAEIRPFVWRRHLDFAAIADIRGMKQRMDAHKGTRLPPRPGPEELLGYDVKLGEGGIREIEFCAQALQLVWGGHHAALRVPGTIAALGAQAAAGHITEETRAALDRAYRFLRHVEHRLQMVADRQTHALPGTMDGLQRFAVFAGFDGAADFAAALRAELAAVHAIFGGVFAGLPGPAPAGGGAAASGAPDALLAGLAPAWLEGRPRALRTERARALLRELLPALGAALSMQPDPPAAAARLDEFIHRLPAGVQVFSMLQHNPALLQRLADVLGAAPWLADHLAAVPAALEGLAGPGELEAAPGPALALRLADARSLDDAPAIMSRFVRETEFAIAVAEYFGRIGVDAAGEARTRLADAVIARLLDDVMAEHRAQYGRVAGGGMAVLALGKAGSGTMMAGSDLDLMLIYGHDAAALESDGRRKLAPSQYFARAAQAFVAALTVQTRHGPLYAVDMRLRPSGRSGPVAVSLESFRRYHAESAWTWERLALARARVVAGPPGLRRRLGTALAAALAGGEPGAQTSAASSVLADTLDMRRRLLRDAPAKGPWDVKLRDGGLMELEFIAQALLLCHFSRRGRAAGGQATGAAFALLAQDGVLAADEAAALIAADRLWRGVQSLLRIGLGREVPRVLPGPVVEKLLKLTGFGPDEAALRAGLQGVAATVRAAFNRHVGEI